jgi:HEAT repeat protein
VGISHGEIISGPIGAKDRMDFTVIGDVVNLASRIEKLSKLGKHTKIVFSNHVETLVRSLLKYEEISIEKIAGKQEEVHVYELIGVMDLSHLIKNIMGEDVDLKRRSVEILGQSRNLEALPHVIRLMDDREETVRLQAAVALSKLAPLNDSDALEAVFNALHYEKSLKVLATLVAVAGKVCSTDRILELAPFLESPHERIVANTIEAMGQVRSPRCIDSILPKLNSRNNRIKANAAMSLFAAGQLEVIHTLKPMLMHSDPLMRSSAAFAIGELTLIAAQEALAKRWTQNSQEVRQFLAELQECVPALVSMLRDPEAVVKRQAVIALGKIKDKSAVLPMIDMIQPALGTNTELHELIRDVTQALRSIGAHKLVREVIARLSS